MKKLMLIVMAVLLINGSMSAQSSTMTNKEKMKQRKEILKQNNKLQKVNVDKASRKQAKQMKKDGWKVAPGNLPLDQQISRSTLFQNQFEDDLITPKYVWGDATSVSANYDGGKMQALALARVNLVSSIENHVTQIVENNRDNKQLDAGNAATVIKTLSESQSFVTKRLGQTIPVVEVYRDMPNGNKEVRVMIFYSMDTARDIARDAICEQLEKEGGLIDKETIKSLLEK